MLKSLVGVFIIINSVFYSDFIHFDKKMLLKQSDTIVWSGKYRLDWNDFQGRIPLGAPPSVKAQTQSGIYVEQIGVKENIPKYRILTYFLKKISWTKVSSEKILIHEQLHFDISELYSRKLRKSFDSLNSRRVTDRNVYEQFYNSNFIKLNHYQDQYDQEVYADETVQEEWIDKIAMQLYHLRRYGLAE